ncbi:MAG: IS200/IS605 family transposase [Spirochaetaceae bacterium]|nr:IS200/IS605 family transposase [Spirochaetaceae bacterium]
MANTYTQIYLQLVFAVKWRKNLIQDNFREELHKYITGIVENRKQKLIAINSMPDHIHILVGFGTTITIADLVHDIKIASTNFINDHRWLPGKFAWQNGYGGFSYSRSHLDRVVKYILNQQKHHKRNTFKEEYIEFLEKYEVLYDSKYLFDWIEKPYK